MPFTETEKENQQSMVLSNKKLKQKLRAELAHSLAASEAKTDLNNEATENRDKQNPKPQSLKKLLDLATQRPRLSKRDKHRQNRDGEDNKEIEPVGSEDKKKKKKRKRDGKEKNGNLDTEEHEVLKEVGNLDTEEHEVLKEVKNSETKKKNKKNKKKKQKKAAKNEEEKGAAELGSEEQRVAETNKNSDSQANGDVTTKVYVGGIPYYSTEDDIRSYFEGCGTITEVDCMKFPESGKFRGIAIISFKTEAAAKRALALDGADMGGLFLKIQPYKTTRTTKGSDFAPKHIDGYNRVYLGNLSWDITDNDLRKLFSDCNISSIRFGMNKETGQFRGYAHVDFSDSLSLTMALKLDQKVVCGRPVRITCAVPKKGAKTHPMPLPTTTEAAKSEVTNSEVSSISGKMRRRTCYECGEKGHISSDCPKKQTDAPTYPNPS
ncbi:phragmoplastin interacting protein 1 [Ziziphus jujuba]|uniref:Phragmoplastin interacting protein 1 n=1 Tax=Ziziphus jujuba TaxID=326968 RepID=A0A6P3ZFZ0_ZIZJJ|nr:phragmoplastin interacting protein 1 [Ziziphus jujuba]